MHPRQQARTGQQRRFTDDQLRRFDRQQHDTPAVVAAVRPPCAFHALNGRIAIARPFAVHFPFAGIGPLAFDPTTPVELCQREGDAWRGNDAMVVIAELAGMGERYRLAALPRRQCDNHDIILGGFDLDGTGAVLSGSFWDANLDAGYPTLATDPVATRMAQVFVDRAKDGFDDTTQIDLVREGFSEREVLQHYEAAAALSAADLRDTDVSADRVAYDRQQRVMVGANAVAGLLLHDTANVHTACRLAGLSTVELGKLFDDIIGEAMRLVREARSILVAVQ